MQKPYKNDKEIYSIFSRQSFGQKKAPAGRRTAKKKVFEKHKQGGHEKGLGQRDEKKSHLRSFQAMMVTCYIPRAWLMAPPQALAIPQGHPPCQGRTREGPKQPKICQKHQITRILGRGWSKLTFDQGDRHEILFWSDLEGQTYPNIAYLMDFEEIRFF